MINMNEETFYEGGPAKSDLIINLLAGITILGLPFTFAAIVRALWLRYKITNKRITIDGGWFGKNKTQVSFSNIEEIVNNSTFKDKKFDIILFDIGTSSNQIDNAQRGFSFNKSGPLDMRMGASDKKAYDIINNYEEKNLADIIYQYGEERYSRVIAKEIVKNRKIKFISDTIELSNIIKKCLPKKNQLKNKIHPATKTFQAIRIYINDELNELKTSLEKTLKILNKDGLILVVSFQSLEDRIVKDFFNHNSGKRWRSSRHYPELPDKLATQLKIITKKPILPSASEILENPRSRSAKLRVAQKI